MSIEIVAEGPTSAFAAEPALAVGELSHSFGARLVLDRIGFVVRPGDFTVVLGLNGAGKTTLFALITRLYYSASGTIRVYGNDIRRAPLAALARIGVVFQQPTLDLDLSVEQNLYYHAALRGMPRRLAAARAGIELDRVGLADRRHERVRQLSGGQRRRVELARALLHEPSLLLLDEPSVGLDVAARRFLLDHVRELCRTRGLAVLWATHLLDEASDDARVVVLHQGHVLAQGSVPEVVAAAGAASIAAAFEQLIGAAAMR